MYFFVSSHSLLQKLDTLYKIYNYNNSNPKYLIFKIIGNKLKITALFDSKNVIKTFVKINVKRDTKENIIVSTKFIINFLTTFSDEMLFFKKKKNSLNICSKQGSYNIPLYCHSDSINSIEKNFFIKSSTTNSIEKNFFIKSSTTKITLFSKIFSRILDQTLFAVGDKKFKTVLNGVFFQFSPYESIFTSTDTFRLVKYTIKNIRINKFVNFIISKKSLDIIKKILENEKNFRDGNNKNNKILIEYNKKINIVFHFQNYIFSCRIINEKYPDYNFIIPNNENLDVSIVINRFLLVNAIKRIFFLSDEKKKFIHFQPNNNDLQIYSHNFNFKSNIRCKSTFLTKRGNKEKIKKIKMSFNSKFLIEILSSLNEEFIFFEFYHSKKIGILSPVYKTDKKESLSILIMSIL
ncbi:DNA polymerase III subunit beta [Blattabacterium cuenoti]|uniref:DNA polymerase III subunit beta n=1 Tax=Blattabacterium cuenoti TaxID=1653831 RepID=UPI00163B9D2D|nr:DNA polymerase III subunit beta [Blattabacterium cuenoti]